MKPQWAKPQTETQDETRYCELGDHQAYRTIRCIKCLRYFCNKHVHEHKPRNKTRTILSGTKAVMKQAYTAIKIFKTLAKS